MRAPCGKVKEWGLSQPTSSILMILSTITHPVVGEPPFSGNPHLTILIFTSPDANHGAGIFAYITGPFWGFLCSSTMVRMWADWGNEVF